MRAKLIAVGYAWCSGDLPAAGRLYAAIFLVIRKKMFETLSYYWTAARGYRLKPWKSPYILWRFETFLGKEAADMTPRKFFHLAWKYREPMEQFVDWAAERRRFQRRHA